MANVTAIEKVYSPSLYGTYVILLVTKDAVPTVISDSRLSIDGISYKSMGEVNRLRSRFKRAGGIASKNIRLVGREVKREE